MNYDLYDYVSACLWAQFPRSRHNRRVDQRLIRGNFGLGLSLFTEITAAQQEFMVSVLVSVL